MATKTKKSSKYYLVEDIRDVLLNEDPDFYQDRIDDLMEFIKEDISRRHLKCLITLTKTTTKEMTLGNYLTYLILFKPFYYFDEEPTDKMLFEVLPIKNFENYLDRAIQVFGIEKFDPSVPEDENSVTIIGQIIVDIIDQLNKISYIITAGYGPTFSLYQFIDLANRNERFAEILYEPDKDFKNNDTFDMKAIVEHTRKICNEIIDIVKSDDVNTFKYFITSGSGVKPEQFAQLFGFIGAKPDLREKIIPKESATNFAMGLRNVQDFYINSVGCLKALITSHVQVKNSGYFTRKLEILLNDEFLNKDVEDCKTKHLMPLFVKDKNYLEKIAMRNFSRKVNGKKLEKITYDGIVEGEFDDLIGETIYLRDPALCACKKGICKTCYGDLWKVTGNLNIGIIACLIMTNKFTQTMLSTKHLLQAKVKNKNLSVSFLKYFTFNRDKVVFKGGLDENIRIEFEAEAIENEDEDDMSSDIKIYNFTIVDGDEKHSIESEIPLFFNEELKDDLESYYKNGVYSIKVKDVSDFDYVFSHSIDNNGLSRTMLLVKDLIDKNEHLNEYNIYEFYNKFIELLVESNTDIAFVHISIIIKNMMGMNTEDGREAFAKSTELPDFTIYKIGNAILYNSPSVSKPIQFEQLGKQLTTDVYGTSEKDEYSSYDELLK